MDQRHLRREFGEQLVTPVPQRVLRPRGGVGGVPWMWISVVTTSFLAPVAPTGTATSPSGTAYLYKCL